jgi:hypothetical protein
VSEKWFLFCLIWSVMAAVDEKGRKMLDQLLRDIEAQFPPTLTVYDYWSVLTLTNGCIVSYSTNGPGLLVIWVSSACARCTRPDDGRCLP